MKFETQLLAGCIAMAVGPALALTILFLEEMNRPLGTPYLQRPDGSWVRRGDLPLPAPPAEVQ